MVAQRYDLLVIGGGSGGLSVAERAAGYGARCGLIEAERLGGTCVNAGCVPKKIMWHAAHLAHALDDAAGYGFRLDYFGFEVEGWIEGYGLDSLRACPSVTVRQ